MTKFIAIGDIHGRSAWKKINPDLYEKIIFVGDYVDGALPDHVVVENFRDIIEFKRNYEDKVVLLTGNHDIQYIFWQPGNPFQCSGYRSNLQPLLTKIFNLNPEYFQVAYQIDNFLFTHAGLSTGWYNYCETIIDEYQNKFQTKNIAETLNIIFRSKDTNILHLVSHNRRGLYPYGGITWADWNETVNNALEGYHQIVGHTRRDNIQTYTINDKTKITYIDVLSKVEDFYEYPVTFE